MCWPVLYPQMVGGAREDGVVNSSLSLLQSQLEAETVTSRLKTTKSRRKKQMSGSSLLSL